MTLSPTKSSSNVYEISTELKEELALFDGLINSEIRASSLRDFNGSWKAENVKNLLEYLGIVNPDENGDETLPEDIATLHSIVLKVLNGDESEHEVELASPTLVERLKNLDEGKKLLDMYSDVLDFMRGVAEKNGTKNLRNSTERDWLLSIGILSAGGEDLDVSRVITRNHVIDNIGKIMEIATKGLTGLKIGSSMEDRLETRGIPPIFIITIIATIVLVAANYLSKEYVKSSALVDTGVGNPPATQLGSSEDMPQVPSIDSGGDGDDDPPVATPTLVPTATKDVLTIEKLSEMPVGVREAMMFEATGLNLMASDESPHLGYEVVQGEDGSFSIERVYNIITGEIIDVPDRERNVDPGIYTLVGKDWSALDTETHPGIQSFPRIDGKGIVVLERPVSYAVVKDDPTTPDVREYITTRAPEWVKGLEFKTFTSMKDLLKYALLVEGAEHNREELRPFEKDIELANKQFRYFYGQEVLVNTDVRTPDGKVQIFISVRRVPTYNGFLVVFSGRDGMTNYCFVEIGEDGMDSNGLSIHNIMDELRVIRDGGDPTPSTYQKLVPSLPDDFLPRD